MSPCSFPSLACKSIAGVGREQTHLTTSAVKRAGLGRSAVLGPRQGGVCLRGEARVAEAYLRRQLDVEVVRGVEPGAHSSRPRVEDVAAALARLVDEVQVIAGDLDPLDVVREAKADHRACDLGELELALLGDDRCQRAVGRALAGDRARADALEAA